MGEDVWSDARSRMMLDPTITNLNTGSWGPTPRPVFDQVTEYRRLLAQAPMDFYLRISPPLLWRTRERLAPFLGGDPRRLVFTANVSVSVNIIAAGLRLAAPGEVLLTDHEYGAMHWCWERAAQRQGLSLRTFSLPVMADDPAEIVATARRAMTERTRLLFISHVLSPTGLVLPVEEICAEAWRRGIVTVIDGAHAPAMVDVAVDALGCDFYTGNCHKWLLAPHGCGFLYLGRGSEDRLQPLMVSWGYHHDRGQLDEPDEFGSTPRLRALEFEGTREICPWLAVPSAIDFQQEIGWERIRGRIAELVAHVRARFDGRAGLKLHTPTHPALHGSMTAFRLPDGLNAQVLRQGLWKHRIEAPIVERPDGLLLRISTHFYNTREEIDRLAELWPAIMQAAQHSGDS